jgi:DNA-binding beta-propeller fold protein YncE
MHRRKSTIPIGRSASFGLLALSAVLLFICPTAPRAVTAELLHIGNGFSPGSDLSRPLGVFYDNTENECYIADTGNHQVVVFDDNGMPIFRFYHHVTVNGERQLGEPKNLVVDADGQIYITDAMVPYLDILDRNGRRITSVEPPFELCGPHVRFDGVAIGPNNKVYASLSGDGKRMVAVIGLDMELEKVIALRSQDLGASCITALDVDTDGNFYVTDPCAELMVQVYDTDGQFVLGFGRHNSGDENFSHPSGISVMPSGEIWIVDSIRQVVSCFSSGGEFISHVGGKGNHPGAFNFPSGIDTDGNDRLFVVERAGNRYQCFRIVSDDMETAGK